MIDSWAKTPPDLLRVVLFGVCAFAVAILSLTLRLPNWMGTFGLLGPQSLALVILAWVFGFWHPQARALARVWMGLFIFLALFGPFLLTFIYLELGCPGGQECL